MEGWKEPPDANQFWLFAEEKIQWKIEKDIYEGWKYDFFLCTHKCHRNGMAFTKHEWVNSIECTNIHGTSDSLRKSTPISVNTTFARNTHSNVCSVHGLWKTSGALQYFLIFIQILKFISRFCTCFAVNEQFTMNIMTMYSPYFLLHYSTLRPSCCHLELYLFFLFEFIIQNIRMRCVSLTSCCWTESDDDDSPNDHHRALLWPHFSLWQDLKHLICFMRRREQSSIILKNGYHIPGKYNFILKEWRGIRNIKILIKL